VLQQNGQKILAPAPGHLIVHENELRVSLKTFGIF
jgi:hypothetical protein